MSAPNYRDDYLLHLLTSLSCTLALCIALITWWPIETNHSFEVGEANDNEVVRTDTITATHQKETPPPPPPPAVVAPRISVPTDMRPAEEPLDLDISWQSSPPPDGEKAGAFGNGQHSFATRFSEEAPRPIQFAEPPYPAEAWKRGISAQIIVEVVVDERGRAKIHRITDRYLIERSNSSRSVSAACCSRQIMQRELVSTANRSRVKHLGHGLEEAALRTAWKWRFEPPRKKGQALTSYAVLTFTFGQ